MERNIWIAIIAASFILFAVAGAEELAVKTSSLRPEIALIKRAFEAKVGKLQLPESYLISTAEHCQSQILANPEFQYSQCFFYVDRNPRQQVGMVCFWDSILRKVEVLGTDKVSTGNPDRPGFYETPVGFLKNTASIMGYRAKGTKNSKGWRGLGAAGSRVWDFGWQKTWKNGYLINIRLLMHATDPDQGEPRLGYVDSKGCIRVSAKLNYFLDHYGIIDQEYEVADKVKRIWLLRANREPTRFAGKFVLVGDSRNY